MYCQTKRHRQVVQSITARSTMRDDDPRFQIALSGAVQKHYIIRRDILSDQGIHEQRGSKHHYKEHCARQRATISDSFVGNNAQAWNIATRHTSVHCTAAFPVCQSGIRARSSMRSTIRPHETPSGQDDQMGPAMKPPQKQECTDGACPGTPWWGARV